MVWWLRLRWERWLVAHTRRRIVNATRGTGEPELQRQAGWADYDDAAIADRKPRSTLTTGATRPVPMTVALVFTRPSSTPDSSFRCRALVRLRKPQWLCKSV